MNIEPTKVQIIEILGSEFPVYKYVKSREGVELVRGDTRKGVYVILNKFKSGALELRLWCGIRNRKIEEIFHKFSGLAPAQQLSSSTLNLTMEPSFRAKDETEIPLLLGAAKTFVRQKAIPFLDQDYPIKIIEELLNSNPNENSMYQRNPHNRCSYGLISAKLADSSSYEHCKRIYSDFMQASNKGFYYPNFLDLVQLLESNA